MGLYYLRNGDFRQAASHFGRVPFELGNSYNEVCQAPRADPSLALPTCAYDRTPARAATTPVPPRRQVISAADVGLYGSLCALASYNRHDLKQLVRPRAPGHLARSSPTGVSLERLRSVGGARALSDVAYWLDGGQRLSPVHRARPTHPCAPR